MEVKSGNSHDGGTWKVVEETAEEFDHEGLGGVVGVRQALVKSKQKQVSRTDSQLGIVAVKNYLKEPIRSIHNEKNKDDFLSRPSSGILGVRGYMVSGEKKSEDLNNKNVKEVAGEWRVAMNQEKPPDMLDSNPNIGIPGVRGSMKKKLDYQEIDSTILSTVENVKELPSNLSIGILGVRRSMSSSEKNLDNQDNETTKFSSAKNVKEILSNPGIGIVGVYGSMSSGKKKLDNQDIEGTKFLTGKKKVNSSDDQDSEAANYTKETTGAVGVINKMQNDSFRVKSKSVPQDDLTSLTSRNYLDCESGSTIDSRETPTELTTFVTKTYLQLVAYNDDPNEPLSDNDDMEEFHPENDGLEVLHPHSEIPRGARGTKYNMSFVTQGRRFSGAKKKSN